MASILRPPYDYPAAIDAARRSFDRASSTVIVREPTFAPLKVMAGDIRSQNGEDGLIAGVLARIGTHNRWCFEVGAADGTHLSNTWALWRDGWQAVLIEADPRLFDLLQANRYGRAHLFHEKIGPDSLDRILAAASAPLNLDLGVIDIDGEDLQAWAGMQQYRPRVMLVEYNPDGDCIQGGRTVWQAGLDSIAALGRRKGYRLLATTACNALFVDEEALGG